MKTLPRFSSTTLVDDTAQLRATLGERAATTLGYTRLKDAATPGTLLNALVTLNIMPLQTQSVEAYKASKTKIFVRQSTWRLSALWSAWGVLLTGSARLAAANKWYWFVLGIVGFVASLGGLFGLVISTFTDEKYVTPRRTRYWKTWTLRDYSSIGAVPEFVLDKALQIKAAVPTAEFHVAQLVTGIDEDDRRRLENLIRMRDPFLVVTTGYESYYIDVWDEAEYERILA